MMSGVELNALINQIQANDGLAGQSGDNSQLAVKTEKSTKSYNNYNREIWRVQGGILESSLVDFCVQRTRSKFIDDITSKRKPNLTLFKEDWLDLIDTLKRIISDIVEKGDPRSEWLKTVEITHQLCAQKYRNLKKVYHISKQKDSRKFSYKREFKEIEDLSSTVLQESTKVLTANSQLSLVPTLTVPVNNPVLFAENGMSLNPQSQDNANPVKMERVEDAELGVEEILVTEDERIESPDSSYTSPTHLGDDSPQPKTEPFDPMQTPPVTSVSNFIPLVMGGAKKIGAEELIARLGHFIGENNQENKVKLVSTKTDVKLSEPVKAALSGLSGEMKTSTTGNGQSLNGTGAGMIEKMLLKLTCMMESWHRESREHQARIERIMTDRLRASDESNRLLKEKIELEREKLEFMKLRRTIEEMRNTEVLAPVSSSASVYEIDEKPQPDTDDPDDIPIIESVESA